MCVGNEVVICHSMGIILCGVSCWGSLDLWGERREEDRGSEGLWLGKDLSDVMSVFQLLPLHIDRVWPLTVFCVCCLHHTLYMILCVWVFCLTMCLCGVSMSGIHGDQKRALDPSELQLQMKVSTWVLKTKPRSSGRSISAPNHHVISLAPMHMLS